MKGRLTLVLGLVLIAAIFVAYTYQGSSGILALSSANQKGHLTLGRAQRGSSTNDGLVRLKARLAPPAHVPSSTGLPYETACISLIAPTNERAMSTSVTAIFVPPEAQMEG